MGKGRVCLLLLGLLLTVALVPVQVQGIDWENGAILALGNTVANLGELKTDPFDPTLEYFEAENAISFTVLVLLNEWQLLLSGEDFVAGAERIPLAQMEWKLRNGTYRRMPAAGSNQELMRISGFLRVISDSLSFRLVLKGDESPGHYSSTLTLTLVNL
ncbi:hypothetical protein [Capillibacterium thermochitinicola]|uniref:Uncharacterized protein n=1 Tax=Capillibacterium thermochitinicola TaxID=2699427 RepID=A0A8J6I0D4_9FIRM|nr:hypothetical protein [Capillibacterium thermochitinicola]MBA2132653.1 hypothetical protein [Capillibacterium thermochitinicola]